MLTKLRQWAASLTPSGRRANELMASVRADSVTADPPDERDYEWQDLPTMVLPSAVDLSHLLIAIENQKQTGSCVAQSGTSILEAVKAVVHEREQLSRLHLYWHARAYHNATSQDAGTTLRYALKAMYHVGVSPEAVWPFYEAGVYVKPSPEADAAAASNKATRYERIKDSGAVEDALPFIRRTKEALATGHPVFLAMRLERSFFYLPSTKPHNYLGMGKANAEWVGNHAMVIVGYFYVGASGYFIVANSWGENWGKGGFCFLPMLTVISDSLDLWVVREFDGVDVMAAWRHRASIARMYVALFGRAPDAEGLMHWMGRLGSPALIADAMFDTTPARAYYPDGMNARDIVRAFYVNVLGREPDDGGLDHWTGRMLSEGVGPTIAEIIAICADYTGVDPAGKASAQLFADKTAKALRWAESGGGIVGSHEAIL